MTAAGKVAPSPIGKAETKRQHYVPRFFLSGFTSRKDGKFDVLRRTASGVIRLSGQRVENVAVERNLYEVKVPEAEDGKDNLFPNGVENLLSQFEGSFSGRFRVIIEALLEASVRKTWTDAELEDICDSISIFIAALYVRNPKSVKKMLENAKNLVPVLEQSQLGTSDALEQLYSETMGSDWSEKIHLTPEMASQVLGLSELVSPSKAGIEKGNKYPLIEYAEYLRNCSFQFLTTAVDQPFIGISEPHFEGVRDSGRSYGLLYFPLSSRLAVLIVDDDKHTFEKKSLNRKQLRLFNRAALVGEEWDWAFCSRGDYLDSFRKRNSDNE
ncbi:DUF4238 domain-containing protein [Bifidobacterium sp. ESL0732]|uniref:DUF4238 domain-containing protein n=1 Tax=Bifidobacterium sp. ESL0732 TaxID=2983222 RepID=UPI0023F79EAE|nr:DUF4238 domain-containing protein [Bifidobacterium sp. ESL0732]WEV64533.1 DUF4238 domain-containing protein [Bifidobacterium sp. ESL0732]